MLLEEKNIFLTGGSRGLGRATVFELVKYGANVAFTYVNDEEAARKTVEECRAIDSSRRVSYHKLDIRNSAEVDSVADQVISQLGRVDVVINNAGVLKDSPIFYMSDKDWDYVVQVHMTGTFYVCRAFLEEFIVNKGGKFINIGSLSYTGSAGQANYSAAKAGMIGFSKALAKEYGHKDIYCNVIIPGFVETDLTKANASDEVIGHTIRLSSLQRLGEADEVGKVVVFCASDLSSYINGTVIHATGGIEVLGPINERKKKKKKNQQKMKEMKP
jgi:3-oxoacyl-[acyl-carrier protein] reductase